MIHRVKNKVRILHLTVAPPPSSSPSLVITGLVPVIPMDRSAVPHRIGMAGTSPAMTKAVRDGVVRSSFPLTSSGCGWRDGNGGAAII
jgi:hypothetical protein